MLVEEQETLIDSQNHRKRQKRHSSFFFSSPKALKRSRMTRGKRLLSKTGQSTDGDPRKVLRFGTSSSAGEEDTGEKTIHADEEMAEDNASMQEEATTVNVSVLGHHPCSLN
jgi:hypothetical protein